MTSAVQLVNNKSNTLTDTPELFFTSPSTGSGTLVESFTAANNSTSNKTYKAYIVGAGDSVTAPIRPMRIVIWAEIDLGIGIVNQLIPPGGALYIESSLLGSIGFTISGRNIDAS